VQGNGLRKDKESRGEQRNTAASPAARPDASGCLEWGHSISRILEWAHKLCKGTRDIVAISHESAKAWNAAGPLIAQAVALSRRVGSSVQWAC